MAPRLLYRAQTASADLEKRHQEIAIPSQEGVLALRWLYIIRRLYLTYPLLAHFVCLH